MMVRKFPKWKLSKLKKQAKRREYRSNTCERRWIDIYSARFAISGFPCQHIIGTSTFSLGSGSPQFNITGNGSVGTRIACAPCPESKKLWSFSKLVEAYEIQFDEKDNDPRAQPAHFIHRPWHEMNQANGREVLKRKLGFESPSMDFRTLAHAAANQRQIQNLAAID
jgi:hypothetical protein